MRHIYTEIEKQFLKDNVKGITEVDLVNLFNKRFNLNVTRSSIGNQKAKLHIKSGIVGGQFKKGHKPHNKGKKQIEYMCKESIEKTKGTRFKKGNIPHNHRKVGSERISKDGYIEIKTKEPNVWNLKHRYIYEMKYGKIPEGFNLIFLDGNKTNLDINNLKLVEKAEDLIMNNKKLFTKDKELTYTGTIIAKVINKKTKLKRNKIK